MKLVILCEGETEEAVLEDFLNPFCQQFDGVQIINTRGAGRLKAEFKHLAERELQTNDETVVVCLIDLYQAPFSYPRAITESATPHEAQFGYIKQYMEERIAPAYRQRFFAFPVVMEIETWLLADDEGLNDYFKPQKSQRISSYPTPESISHPARELELIWKRHKKPDFSKTRHGTRLFKLVNAERVYEDNCPHFEIFINQLLRLQGLPIPKDEPAYAVPDAEHYNRLAVLQKRHDAIYELVTDNPFSEIDDAIWGEFEEIESEIDTLNQQIQELHTSMGE